MRVVAEVKGEILALPVGGGRWVAWLEGEKGEARLMVARRYGGRPVAVLSAAELSGLAMSGETAYLTRKTGAERRQVAELVRVRLPERKPMVIAAVPRLASQIAAGDGWVCWREDHEADLPGVPFAVAGAPMTVIRAVLESGGEPEAVAAVTGVTAGPRSGGLDLLGVAAKGLYWVQRTGLGSAAATAVRRADLPAGKTGIVVMEPGWRPVALGRGALFWTVPSLEAAAPDQFAAVKQARLDGPGAKVIADWLGSGARLMVTSAGVYAQDRELLWDLGGSRGEQRVVARGLGWVSSATMVGDEQYLVMESKAGTQIAGRPVTWGARLRSLLP